MKKKIGLLLFVILFLVSLTGCLPKQVQKQTQTQERAIALPAAKEVEFLPEDLSNFIFATDHLFFENCEATEGLSTDDFQFNAAAIDLNQDGQAEYMVEPYEVCGQMIRGASGNGPYMVYQKVNSEWQEIGVLEGNGYSILGEKTNGFYDIQTSWHDSATSYYVSLYQAEKDEILGVWYKLIKKELTSPQRE